MPDTALIYFTPCCAPGDTTIIFRGAPIAGMTSNSYWVYTDPTAILGQGTAPWDSLIPGQCYNIFFGSTPGISTAPILTLTVSSFSNSLAYFPTQKTCIAPYCVNICNNLPPQEFTNRYYKFTPCCDPDNPVYFKPVTLGTQIATGVAIYSATITPSPYPTTDIFGNPDNPLIANFCYSITLENAGPGMHVTNATEWNNLQEAPNNTASNFLYVSQGTSCTNLKVISSCPSCNPFCFTLWSCDASQPLFTTYTDLTAYIGTNILVSSLDPDDNIVDVCVFVQDSTGNNCTNAIEVVVESESCECDCTCYTILGVIKSVEWIDCEGVYHLVATPQSPFQICAGAYPLTYPSLPDNPLQIIDNGLCIESTIFNDVTCEEETVFNCEPGCYLLEDCLDNTNVIYSNSTSLLGPANLGQVVTIAGYTECWKILIPEECICPINVSVLTVSNCCEACLPNINYKLTTCNDSNVYVYTSDDLSLYVDKVIRREDCPEECWIVSQIDGNIPTDIPIEVLEDYLNCELCYRKYYLLEDCLGLELNIITYTDLSSYIDKIITLDWCPETCWEVSETIVDDGAGIISDILNSYTECIDCLTSAPCVCSTIKNYNDISLSYNYLDCEGVLQTITLQPGQKSDRLCLIRWYVPESCDELIITKTVYIDNIPYYGYYFIYQNSLAYPAIYVNDKPTWHDHGTDVYIYYDGTKWIFGLNVNQMPILPVYNTIGYINCNGDCDCPLGTWQQSSSIPNQDVYTITEYKYTIEYFGNCINGRCPARKNKQKSITPGYNTPGCEAWKYEEISCRAAEAMYKQVLQLRYGISNCCPEEDERYIIQKELIDLQAMIPPDETPPPPPLPITSYNCTNGTCVLVSGSGGQYPTLAACEENCTPLPVTSYNCVDGFCIDPGDGSGQYPTLLACQTACIPTTSWNCVDCECESVSGSGGTYPTEIDCLESTCSQFFITTWTTTISSESITLPYIASGTYSGTIKWGDGGPGSENSYANRTHTYAVAGTYSVIICGTTNGWNFSTTPTSRTKIKSVENWGQLLLGSNTGGYFNGCSNLTLSSVIGTLNLTGITNMQNMFVGCSSITTINGINSWSTSAITNTVYMFSACVSFSQALSFDTSAVTNMYAMFNNCIVFNQPITFNTISVMSMSFMFSNCNLFNQPLSFNTSAVTNMQGMFQVCTALNSPLIFTSTANVTDMSFMFANCTAFNQTLSFNTLAVEYMNNMFANCSVFNQALSFDTSAVVNMRDMFNGCSAFNQALSLNTSAVTDMIRMFANCSAFNSVLTFTSTSAVTTMQGMFGSCWAFNQPLSFNTSAVTDMSNMFGGCSSFNSVLTFTSTSAVTTMNSMFAGCTAFNQPLTFNTSAVQYMNAMFFGCSAFNQNIGTWNVANVQDFSSFMTGKTPLTWPTTYFDNLLCGWSPQIVQPGLTINFGTANYTNATGGPCRTILQSPPNNWTINSGPGV